MSGFCHLICSAFFTVSLAKRPLFNNIYAAFTSFALRFADTCTHGVPIFVLVTTRNLTVIVLDFANLQISFYRSGKQFLNNLTLL